MEVSDYRENNIYPHYDLANFADENEYDSAKDGEGIYQEIPEFNLMKM